MRLFSFLRLLRREVTAAENFFGAYRPIHFSLSFLTLGSCVPEKRSGDRSTLRTPHRFGCVSLLSFICYAGWVSSVAQRVFGGVSVGLVLNKRGDESCVEDLLKFFFRVSACDLRLS